MIIDQLERDLNTLSAFAEEQGNEEALKATERLRSALLPEQMELLQHNLVRHMSCATGQPLPSDVVRAATLLRILTFVTGTSAVRNELVDALAGLLNRGVTPVVPFVNFPGVSS